MLCEMRKAFSHIAFSSAAHDVLRNTGHFRVVGYVKTSGTHWRHSSYAMFAASLPVTGVVLMWWTLPSWLQL